MTISSTGSQELRKPLGFGFLMFCLYTFVLIGRPQDYVPALVPLRLAIVLTILTLLITVFQNTDSRPFRFPETRLYLFLFLVMCLGIPFSLYRRESFMFVLLGYSANLVFFLLWITHVNTLQKFKRILFVLVAAGLIFTILGLLRGEFKAGRYFTGSRMFDPNDTAFVEIAFFAFATSLLLSSSGLLTRAVALAMVISSVVLALYTGSRGGLLGFSALFVSLLFLKLPGLGRGRKAATVLLIGAAIVVNFEKLNIERYMTLGSLDSDYNTSDEFGRAQIWSRGVELFFRNPLTGVGVNEFGAAIGAMRDEENLIPEWQAAHNSYVQILTETGIFGAAAFLLLILASLKTLNRLRRQQTLSPSNPDLQVFPGVLLVGVIGQLVAASFLSQAYSMSFTLIFAMTASLREITVKAEAQGRPEPAVRPIQSRLGYGFR